MGFAIYLKQGKFAAGQDFMLARRSFYFLNA